jgi:hypothetical protein
MKRTNLLIISAFSLTALSSACSTAPTPTAENNANSNVAVLQNNSNPIAGNVNIGGIGGAATNSAVPGIPNAPANMNMSKIDMTKNAKVQNITSSAPDNSEISVSLGQYPIETRTFKSHPQLAKVERIDDVANKKVRVKVYLKNGQVKEIPENIINTMPHAMAAPAAELLKAAADAQPARAEPKIENPPLPAPGAEPRLQKQGVPQKQQ